MIIVISVSVISQNVQRVIRPALLFLTETFWSFLLGYY